MVLLVTTNLFNRVIIMVIKMINFKEKVVVVPFGLEKTVSYGGGTRNGPKEIIKASHQVELYDEELHCEPYKKIGIKTLKPFKIDKDIKKALKKMSNINQEY